jgi:Tfp pilus assembly protein PilE
MRKLMIVAAILSVLAWATVALPSHTAHQLTSPQIAGDVGPVGG